MIVDVVGTACTWFKRKNTSFVLDKKIVFDTPAGSYKDIIKLVDIFDLEAVIISHFHGDHFLDLHCITTQIMRHSKAKGRTKRLKIIGPYDIGEQLIALNKVQLNSEQECSVESYSDVIEFISVSDGDTFELENYSVEVYKMIHGNIDCNGFVFTDKTTGKRFGFTADTAHCENLEKMAASSDYLFCDAASPDPSKHKTHLSFDEFVELTKKYPDTVMYPVHTCDKNQERAKEEGFNYLEDSQVVEIN